MYSQILSGFFRDNFNDRRFLTTAVIGRLKGGVDLGGAEASLKTIASRLESAFPKDNASRSVALTPLADAAVGVNNRGQIVLAGGLMMGIVGLVLLIACVNVANLVLAVLSGIVGIAIAYGGRAVLWSFRPPFILDGDLDIAFDSHVLFFTLSV